MAVSASAFGAHIVRALDDMLRRGPLRKELRGDARKLRGQLKRELPYAADAENQALEEDRARQWLAELRRVLYRADHLLQAYGAGADDDDAPQSERASIFRLKIMRRFTTDRYIKQEIRNLLTDIGSVSKNRPSTLTNRRVGNDQHDRSCDGQEFMCNDNLVGPEIDLKILPVVDKLTDHEPSRQFIIFAIYGLAGVGKETIARKIFDDQRTQSAFSTRVWVSISKGSSVDQILLATCAAIGVLEVPKTKNKLQLLLADKIGGRRIFLVFNIYNGVPSKIFGNIIEALQNFHAAAEGSRVLITTSDENVGNEIKSAQIQKGAEGYGLQTECLWQLPVEDGWRLLLRAACLEQAKVTPELKKIGVGILQKCNCLPLAIKAVGGVLHRKGYSQKEWEGVHDNRAFSLKDPTTGTEGVRSSIYLSYQYALPHLKQCFLYLSLFPLDFIIEQHFVTQLWLSEGFIDRIHDQSLEDTADEQNSDSSDGRNSASPEIVVAACEFNISSEHARENSTSSQGIVEDHNSHCSVQEMASWYFKELVERGLLQRENKTKGYKMHEQVRKIAVSLTENEVCAGDPKDVATLSATLYRLSFLNKELKLTTIPEDLGRLKSLRTLLLSGNPIGENDLDIICNNLDLLQVLDLSDTKIQSVPKTLGNLVYLRHLNLSHTGITTLHESIGRLRRLRFLGLQECGDLTSLPKSIQQLLKLEYLNFRDSGITKLRSLDNLRHLALLHGFAVDSISSSGLLLEDLQNMNNLSDLQINIRKIIDTDIENDGVLQKKDNLRNLEIRCCTVNSKTSPVRELEKLKAMFTQLHPHQCLVSLKIDGYYGTSYPKWLCFSELPNLQYLSLVNCKFCERLPPIWHLQKLKFLRIANLSKLRRIDMQRTEEMPSFPNLEELQIEDMEDLEYWSEFQPGDMRRLQKWTLRRCPKLTHLPGGLEHGKIIPTMELGDAGLQVLENIPVQELLVKAMPDLTRVSNLPVMKVFTVISCPNLGILSGVNSLQHIHMEDEQLGQLPKWLEQHIPIPRIETLDIVGKEELLRRCERNKEDWHIIREIPRVYAYLPKRLPYLLYARSNDFFCKHKTQRTDAPQDHPPPEAGVQRRGFTVSSSSRGNDDSPLESQPPPFDETDGKFLLLGPTPADETYRKILPVMFLFVVTMLAVNLTLSHRNPSEDFSLLFLYAVFLGLLFREIFYVKSRQ